MENAENTRAIPDCNTPWHWAICAQDIAEIKEGNIDTMWRVYQTNYDKLIRICYNACRKRQHLDCVEDSLQQVFIELPRLNYTNTSTLYGSIDSCVRHSYQCRRSVQPWKTYSTKRGKEGEELDIFATIADPTTLVEQDTDTTRARELIDKLRAILPICELDRLICYAVGLSYRQLGGSYSGLL